MELNTVYNFPTKDGKFGKYGGKFVPETLISALVELEEAYYKLKIDPKFILELNEIQ
jgi:tryptophan synthase beta chain